MTVTVSLTAPARSSVFTVVVAVPTTSMPSRLPRSRRVNVTT
jgi:hypothetical protein